MEEKFYYKLSDEEKRITEEVSKKTITEYDIRGDMISAQNLMYMVEDLLNEVDRLEEELEEEIQDRKDNYKRISYKEMGWE